MTERSRRKNTPDIRVGTAGWSIPRASAPRFAAPGTHLERYARSLRCAEINSSFYRPHAATTYAKWRDSTPPDFRFAVKMPRTITHELKLQDAREPLVAFLAQTDGLAQKRGPLLVQLPPSFAFDAAIVAPFWDLVRGEYRRSGRVRAEASHVVLAAGGLPARQATESHVSQPIRHRCRRQPFRRAGRALHTFDCTVHPGRTGRDMTSTTSRRLLTLFAAFRASRKRGAYSTTPQVARPSRTRGSCTSS